MSLFFRGSFLLLYISALHWCDCGRNTAYGGNDFFDLCSWVSSGLCALEF